MNSNFSSFTGGVSDISGVVPEEEEQTTIDSPQTSAAMQTQQTFGDVTGILQDSLRSYSSGIQQQRAAQQAQLGNVESTMYDQLGRSQLQTERDIAQRRIQALRSGMPSSQLAALELQNVQTAQLGAQEMAQQYDQLRMQLGTELAGAEDMYAAEMGTQLAQSRTDLEAIEGQKFASDLDAQMSNLMRNWDTMTDAERITAIEVMNSPEVEGDAGAVLRDLEQPPGSSGGAVDTDDTDDLIVTGNDGNPIMDNDGNPLLRRKPGMNQSPEQLEYIKNDFNLNSIGAETTGDRLWSTDEINSEVLNVGYRAGKEGSNQWDWIEKIKLRASEGNIKAGDIVDFNYGAGSDDYLYTGDGFIKVSPTFSSGEYANTTRWDNKNLE